MSNPMNRREFMKQTTAAGVGLGLASSFNAFAQETPPSQNAVGANNKITVAVIGTNGRGLSHIQCLTALPGVEVAYICDVDDRAIAKGKRETAKKQKAE